jgi:hypothetical protein
MAGHAEDSAAGLQAFRAGEARQQQGNGYNIRRRSRSMTDLNAIAALLTAYNPNFARKDYQPVFAWLSQGADMELDILPILQHWTTKKPDIYSLRFFTPYVLKAMEARLAVKPVPDAKRAAQIAFATRVVGKCLPRESAWLKAWEAVHGAVSVNK